MSFAIASPSYKDDSSIVIEQAWWPHVSARAAREVLRLDGNVTDPRLQEFLKNAVFAINDELTEWRQAQNETGIAEPSERVQHLYLRAVYFYAHAELLEQYRNYDTTGAGEKRAENLTETIGESRRLSRVAVRDIQGLSRMAVELL